MDHESHSTLEVSNAHHRQFESPKTLVPAEDVYSSTAHGLPAIDADHHRPNRFRNWLIPALLGALLGVLVTGAAVGGGVGGSLASCKNDLSKAKASLVANPGNSLSSTMTGTSTQVTATTASSTLSTTSGGQVLNYTPEPTGLVYNIQNDCTEISNTPLQTLLGDKFNIFCGVDLGSGEDSQQTSNGETLVLADIAGIVAYSLADCLEACSGYTKKATQWSRPEICRSINFNYEMSASIAKNAANCWLKNGTVAAPSQAGSCATCATAMLVSS